MTYPVHRTNPALRLGTSVPRQKREADIACSFLSHLAPHTPWPWHVGILKRILSAIMVILSTSTALIELDHGMASDLLVTIVTIVGGYRSYHSWWLQNFPIFPILIKHCVIPW